jgi:CBS domain containing-hemolysin-like protein
MSPATLAGLALGLLVLRAFAAAFEAALVAVGLPRVETLAQEPKAGRRARALASLVRAPEPTGAALRLWVVLCSSAAAVLAYAAAGAEPLPGAPAVLLAALVSVALSAGARRLGAAHGEPVALALAPAAWLLRLVLAPVGRFLALVVSPVAGRGRFSLPPPPLEEMERAISEYAKSKGTPSDQSTSELIHKVFEFRDKVARDVMVPRTDVVAIEAGTPVDEIIRLLAEEGHSRMPVFRGSLDEIVGTLHARDLVPLLAHPELIVLNDLLRPPHFVPWSKPVDLLLREMQRKKLHMAVVVDEFGGVMGICTLEDVLEEIVGEIHDEFEPDEGKTIEALLDGSFSVMGSAPVGELNRAAGMRIPEDHGYETVAGFVNSIAGAIPAVGDRFFWRGWVFTVSEADRRRATRVRVARVKRTA